MRVIPLLLAIVIVAACASTPQLTAPTATSAVTSYDLDLTVSPDCERTSYFFMSGRDRESHFRLLLQQYDEHAHTFVFELPIGLPAGSGYSAANSGSLTLEVLQSDKETVIGQIFGVGLALDNTHSVGFGGTAALLRGKGFVGQSAVAGTFSGTIGVGIYRLSTGGSCTAVDHAWRLAPN